MLRKVSAGPKGHEISKDSQNMGGGKQKSWEMLLIQRCYNCFLG